MTHPRQDQQDRPRPDDGPRPPSDRLELEVALLAASDPPAAPLEREASDDGARVVLVATRDADLRAYVRACLHGRAGLRVAEARVGEASADAARRVGPDLLIADAPVVVDMPLLLIADEPTTHERGARSAGAPIVVLPQPFNARRLVREVDRLLGAGGERRG